MYGGPSVRSLPRFAAAALVFFGSLEYGVSDFSEVDQDLIKEDYVKVYKTSKDLDDGLQKHKRMLVNFYTSRCEPCKDIQIDYSKAARNTKAEIDLETVVAKVDVTKQTDLVEQFQLKNFPALKYFVDGKFERDYDWKLDGDSIALWLKNREDPPIKEITEEALEGFLEKVEDESFALIARVKPKSVRAKVVFKAIEEQLREWDVAQITFAVIWLPKDKDAKSDSSLTFYRAGIKDPDEEEIDFSGTWSEDRIASWVQKSSYPTIGQTFTRNKYAPQSMEAIGSFGAIVAVVDEDPSIETDEEKNDDLLRPQVEEALLPLATEMPEWRFVMAELSKLEEHENILLGVNAGEKARIIVLGMDKRKFHLIGENEITSTNKIRKFLKNVQAKKVKPYFKSEPEPEEEYDEDGVLTVTGNSFQKQVLDHRKDVFVRFWAPWCKHSDALKPKWGELAKKGIKEGWETKNIVIAEMDASTNECDEDVAHFPYMVFYPAVKASRKFSQKTVYTGPRETEDLFEFVTETARNLNGEDDGDEEDEEALEKKRKKAERKADLLDQKRRIAEEAEGLKQQEDEDEDHEAEEEKDGQEESETAADQAEESEDQEDESDEQEDEKPKNKWEEL